MFEHCIYFNTTSLARKLEREWSHAFKPFDMTPSQAFMLRIILQRPASLQNEIASAMNISRSTATRTLDGLEKLGYTKRITSKSDGREYQIHPTSKAIKIKDVLNNASAEITKKLKNTLGTSTFENVVQQVRSISKKI
jgi:DNA-binding MarR family transcriptional regulator